MDFITQLKRGWVMGLIAYEYTNKHKTVLIFTLLSTLLITATAGFLCVAGFKIAYLAQHDKSQAHAVIGFIGTIIIMGLLSIFITTFLHVALSYYVALQFEDKDVSFFSSLGRALKRIITILLWVFISWTVGILLSQNKKQEGIGGVLTSLLVGALQLGWKVLTFFVIPLIALEDLGIIKTIEQSGQTMKKTFGQNAGATFAISSINFILFTGASLLCWIPGYLLLNFILPAHQTVNAQIIVDTIMRMQHPTATLLIAVLFALPFLIVLPITSAATTIFQVASYHYAVNKPTGPFNSEMIKNSFVTKL